MIRFLAPVSPSRSRIVREASARLRRAFTLIEIMAAVAVMALALGSSLIAMQIGMRNLALARTGTAAAQVLQNEAERLRLLNWAAIEALPASEELPTPEVFDNPALLNSRVSFSRSVANVSGFANMKEILLSATWTTANGREHRRVFRLRYAKGGLHDYYYGTSS